MAGDLMPVDDALAEVLAAARRLPAETVALADALGRVLAGDVPARRTQPPDHVSAMDGYAVRGADITDPPFTLTEVGAVKAGTRHGTPVEPGQCVRIFTGAPLPPGADTVIVQEDTEAEGDRIRVTGNPQAGRHVRQAGGDFREGDRPLAPGRVLTARDIGLLAAMNWPWVPVRRRPRVAILSTGDEIVMPGEPLGDSQIVSANGPALSAFVTAMGGVPMLAGIAPDRAEPLGDMIDAAKGADLLLTTGGASVGEHDLVREALTQRGMDLGFWRIAMRPGKPLIFGRIGETPVLGLPGNPVSSQICAMLFAAPLLRAMQGIEPAVVPTRRARLGSDLKANDRRQDYMRAAITPSGDGGLIATAFPVQDSGMVSALARADGLIVRPPFAPAAVAGEDVEVLAFPSGTQGL
jgi:molybdopterin molybdotransferase